MEPGLDEVVEAIRASWSRETAYASDEYLAAGRPEDRSRGQCGTTALVLQDWFGGDLIAAAVLRRGELAGAHYWNRLPGGREVDLTKDQFVAEETLAEPHDVVRPPGPPAHGRDAYELLSRRVRDLLVGATPRGPAADATTPASAPAAPARVGSDTSGRR